MSTCIWASHSTLDKQTKPVTQFVSDNKLKYKCIMWACVGLTTSWYLNVLYPQRFFWTPGCVVLLYIKLSYSISTQSHISTVYSGSMWYASYVHNSVDILTSSSYMLCKTLWNSDSDVGVRDTVLHPQDFWLRDSHNSVVAVRGISVHTTRWENIRRNPPSSCPWFRDHQPSVTYNNMWCLVHIFVCRNEIFPLVMHAVNVMSAKISTPWKIPLLRYSRL